MKKYQNYKDSNIEWLGQIPEHWQVKRVKDFIIKIGSGVTPKGGSETYVKTGITFLRSQNVYDDGLRIDNVSFIKEEVHEQMKNSQLRPNDILMNITGASIGRSCIVPENLKEANINQHILYFRIKKNLVPFISTYFKSNSIKEYINLIQAGSSKEALTMGQALNIPIVFPPLKEQIQIANYLDEKTDYLDKKINLLQQKINTYQDYRKSLIQKVICKGLDETVKLKESGIDYIGTIPKHWETKRVKELFNIGRGRVIGQGELIDNGKYPVYSSQTENNGCLGYIDSYDFDKNLLTWTTDGVNAGTVFIRSGKFNCTNVCGTLIPKRNNLDLNYTRYSLQESAIPNKRIDTNGAKIMNNEMSIIHIVFPPLSEQKEIANYLDTQTEQLDKIILNLKKQIKALKVYKKTLINEVVTGKIKVTVGDSF